MKTKHEIFLQWNTKFFLQKVPGLLHLDLAKTVRALRILSQKSTRNFKIKELWAIENHVLVNMLLLLQSPNKYHIGFTLNFWGAYWQFYQRKRNVSLRSAPENTFLSCSVIVSYHEQLFLFCFSCFEKLKSDFQWNYIFWNCRS